MQKVKMVDGLIKAKNIFTPALAVMARRIGEQNCAYSKLSRSHLIAETGSPAAILFQLKASPGRDRSNGNCVFILQAVHKSKVDNLKITSSLH
ncbi:MAG: hypothetical protein J0I84_16040 [Terrimonas sp.]|nr:hypothetical protein [Terrimonas sp.]OJY95829.1 MAG: hypothetical protein BGP13_00605 [Sphingobacteriales bacterium 40-81]